MPTITCCDVALEISIGLNSLAEATSICNTTIMSHYVVETKKIYQIFVFDNWPSWKNYLQSSRRFDALSNWYSGVYFKRRNQAQSLCHLTDCVKVINFDQLLLVLFKRHTEVVCIFWKHVLASMAIHIKETSVSHYWTEVIR